MEGLERTEQTVRHARARALVDVRIGMVMAMMKLSDQGALETAMYCPVTGNRCLGSTEGVRRQVVHSDRTTMGYRRTVVDKENPGYFAMVTWDQPAYIWVVEGSHFLLAKARPNQVHALGVGSTAELKVISPYSLFIARGDLKHAGAGSADYPMFENPQVRLHVLFFPNSDTFPNAIHITNGFHPQFLTDAVSDEEEEEEHVEQENSDSGSDDDNDGNDEAGDEGEQQTSSESGADAPQQGQGDDGEETDEDDVSPVRGVAGKSLLLAPPQRASVAATATPTVTAATGPRPVPRNLSKKKTTKETSGAGSSAPPAVRRSRRAVGRK